MLLKIRGTFMHPCLGLAKLGRLSGICLLPNLNTGKKSSEGEFAAAASLHRCSETLSKIKCWHNLCGGVAHPIRLFRRAASELLQDSFQALLRGAFCYVVVFSPS
jgi:hypothetical protein